MTPKPTKHVATYQPPRLERIRIETSRQQLVVRYMLPQPNCSTHVHDTTAGCEPWWA